MNVTYNGESPARNMVTFTDIPNILKFDDNSGSAAKATISLAFSGNLRSQTTYDGQWNIVIMGETITSTLDVAKALNKNFYVSTNPSSTAAYVARALRNCPSINASFTVEHEDDEVELKTRTPMSVRLTVDTNIPSANIRVSSYSGASPSVYEGATIGVDVISDGVYITTLEKKMHNGETAFDMSPVLTTLARIGQTVPYTFRLHALNNGEYSTISNSVFTNYISVGYMCNQGMKYIPMSNIDLAANYTRGTSRGLTNSTLLYLYQPSIPLSFYVLGVGTTTITVRYLDSAFNVFYEDSTTWVNANISQHLKDLHGSNEIMLDNTQFASAFYIDVLIGNYIHLRYNVIKPLKATEYSQRICWRNSYGGISFFDFTGQRSETRSFETSTYNTNIYDYYDNPKNELNKVYDIDVDYSVTLKSHLIENDGKYIFNDMIQSPEVWTLINGERYGIILSDVSVEEQNNNNIYEAVVKYKYSQKPSLI